MLSNKNTIFWLEDLKSSLKNIDESTIRIKKYLLLNKNKLNNSYTLYFNFYKKSFFLDTDKRDGDELLSVKVKQTLYVHYQINNNQKIDFDLLKKHIQTAGEKSFRKIYQNILSENMLSYDNDESVYFDSFQKPLFMYHLNKQLDILYNIFKNSQEYKKINLNNIVKYMNFDLKFQNDFLLRIENDLYFNEQFKFNSDLLAFISFNNFDKILYRIILIYITSQNQNVIKNGYKYLGQFIKKNPNHFNNIIQSIMIYNHDSMTIDQLRKVFSLMKLNHCDNYLIFFNLLLKDIHNLIEFKKDSYMDFILSDEQLKYDENEMENVTALNQIIKNKESKVFITTDSLDVLNAQIELSQIKYKNMKAISNDQDKLIVLKNHLLYLKELKNVLLNTYIQKVENYILLGLYDAIL